jgi:hypothetical protein
MKKLNKPQYLNKKLEILIKSIFFTLIFFWIVFNIIFENQNFSNFFGLILAITALFGTVFTFNRSKEWGFKKSSIGLSLLSISIALFMWFIGQSLYLVDSFNTQPLKIYDFFFTFIDPLYIVGLFFLANSIGTFRYLKSNLSLILLPILIFILNLMLASYLNKGDFFEIILNLNIEDIYIFGSIVVATFVICILLFSKKLGGIYKAALHYILIGILFQYLGDNLFAFFENQTTNGSLADLLFFISISFVIYGVFKLDPEKLNE